MSLFLYRTNVSFLHIFLHFAFFTNSYRFFLIIFTNNNLDKKDLLSLKKQGFSSLLQTVDKVPHFCAGFFYDKSRKLSIIAAFKGLF